MRIGNGRPPPPRPRRPPSSPPAAGVGPDMTAGVSDADSIRGRPGIRGPLGGAGQQAGRAAVDEQVATLLDGAQALLTARGRSWAVLAPGLQEAGAMRLQEAGAMTGEEVLTRLLGLVRELLHARCAALAVAHQGRVLRLLQDEATPASPPPGPSHGSHGLMDRLLDDAQPLRVPSLTTHAAARGWPEPHPTLGSFLGAPIVACGHTIGYLYLVEKQTPDGFTLDDEDLLLSFASTAAPTITSLGLLPDPDDPPPVSGSPTEGAATPPAPKTRPSALQQLVNTARRLTDADAAALVLSAAPGSLQVAAADGSPWADLHGQPPQHPVDVRPGGPTATTGGRPRRRDRPPDRGPAHPLTRSRTDPGHPTTRRGRHPRRGVDRPHRAGFSLQRRRHRDDDRVRRQRRPRGAGWNPPAAGKNTTTRAAVPSATRNTSPTTSQPT